MFKCYMVRLAIVSGRLRYDVQGVPEVLGTFQVLISMNGSKMKLVPF